MGLGHQVYAAVAAGAAAVLTPLPAAAPHSSVRLGSLPFPTNFLNGDHLLLRDRDMENIEERQNRSPAQKILMGCPEMFEPILHCSSCGGESDTSPGMYKDPNGSEWICQCTNQGVNGLTSLVTTTVSRQITTATYELDTLTEYASLRQHITLTTTAAATATSSHDSGIKTIAVVALAGGVPWFLADASGGTAAIAALQPPENTKNHDDGKNCPGLKDIYKDCGGQNQMCTAGTDAGCACEEDTCPADGSEDQPKCADDACAGGNGKCATGDHEGCSCKQPDCPDITKVTFFCSDCGGKGADGKCEGDPEDGNIWVGCDCTNDPDWNSQTPALHRPDAHKHQQALAALPVISYPSKPTPTSLPKPKCDMTDSSKVPWNIFPPSVYTSFCSTINGGHNSKGLTQIADSRGSVTPPKEAGTKKRDIFARTPPPNPDTYSGYTFWLG